VHIAFLDDVSAPAGGGGPTIIETDGASIGLAADSIVGAALWNVGGAASGIAADTVVGVALWNVTYDAVGLAAASADSLVTAQSDGVASGLATDGVIGVALWNGLAASSGLAIDSIVTATQWLTLAAASGIATVTGVADAPSSLVATHRPGGRPYWSLKSRRHPTVFGFPSNTDWTK